MHIVGISSSPSRHSRSAWLLELARTRAMGAAHSSTAIALRDQPARALLQADASAAPIRSSVDQVLRADLPLISTPIDAAARVRAATCCGQSS